MTTLQRLHQKWENRFLRWIFYARLGCIFIFRHPFRVCFPIFSTRFECIFPLTVVVRSWFVHSRCPSTTKWAQKSRYEPNHHDTLVFFSIWKNIFSKKLNLSKKLNFSEHFHTWTKKIFKPPEIKFDHKMIEPQFYPIRFPPLWYVKIFLKKSFNFF